VTITPTLCIDANPSRARCHSNGRSRAAVSVVEHSSRTRSCEIRNRSDSSSTTARSAICTSASIV